MKAERKNNIFSNLLLIKFILLSILLKFTKCVITGTIIPSSAYIGISTTYQFEMSISTAIQSGGYILLTFPSQVILPTSTITCSQIYGFTTTTMTCTRVGVTQVVKVTGSFPSTDQVLIFQIGILTNPSYVSTFYTQITSYDSGNVQLETSGTNSIKFLTLSGKLTLTMSSVTTQIVAQQTNQLIGITFQNIFAATGYIDIYFPKWNPGTQSLSNVQSMYSYSSSDFSASSSGYTIDCSATSHANIKCSFIVANPSTIASISTTFDTLRITGFTSLQSAGSTLQITISNLRFKNPFSLKPITNISAKTFLSTGQNIDTCESGSFSFKVSAIATITSTNILIQPLLSGINSISQYDFTILTPLPLPVGATIQITVPSQIGLYSDSPYKTNLILSSAIGYTPISAALTTSVISSSLQKIQLSNIVPTSSYYVDEQQYVKFSLLLLKNPSSIGSIDAFQFQFFDQSYSMMSGSTSSLDIDMSQGSLSALSLVLTNYRTREKVYYHFKFTIDDDVSSQGQISIKVPSEISVDSSNIVITSVETLSSSAQKPIYTSATRTITIKGAFSSAYSSTTVVEFIIISGLTNPNTVVSTTSGFIISTLDSYGKMIAQSETSKITATPNTIKPVSVNASCEDSINNFTSSLCTYQLNFEMGFNYPILVNSQIMIYLPLEITSTSKTSYFSSTVNLNDRKSQFVIDTSSKTAQTLITIQNAFYPNQTSQTEYIQKSFSIILANLISPRTTKRTTSFKISIYNSEGSLQYKREAGIYGTVSNGKNLTDSKITRSSQVNGENAIYTFTLKLSGDCYKNEYIKVVPPTSIIINSVQSQCQGILALAQTLVCSIKDNALYILLTPPSEQTTSSYQSGTFPSGAILQWQVSNITNPISLKGSDSFQLYITTSIQNNYYVSQVKTGLTFQNQWPGNLTDLQIVPDSYQLGSLTNYNIYFTISNKIPINGLIQVYFPISVYGFLSSTTSNITCLPIKNLETSNFSCALDQSKNLLTMKNAFIKSSLNGGQQISLRILNVKNPQSSVSTGLTSNSQDEIVVRTLDSQSYIIDSTLSVDFSIGCIYPCLTCANQQTSCTSCMTSSSPINQFYLYEKSCEILCPLGYYGDQQNQCKSCQYPCQSCSDNASHCTSCLQTSQLPYLYGEENKCYKECPLTTFQQQITKTCENCISPCLQCSSPTECISCQDSFYFYNQQCFSKCPNTSVPLESTQVKECQDCKAPCKTCENKRDICTSCQIYPDTFYLYENSCLEQCPKAYLPNDLNECVKQDEPIYPFLSLFFTGIIMIVVFISNKIFTRTRLFVSFLAIESLFMIPLWIYLLIFLLKDKHKSSSGIVIIALLLNIAINIFWYRYYKKKVIPFDHSYNLYVLHYPKTQKFILIMSLIFTFQFFRIQYSRLFNNKSLSCVFELKEKYYKKLNRYSLIQMTFVYLPIIAANIYNLNYTWYGRQVYWIDIECIITTSLLFVCHLVIIITTEKIYAVDKQYTFGDSIPQTSMNTIGFNGTYGGGGGDKGGTTTMNDNDGSMRKGGGGGLVNTTLGLNNNQDEYGVGEEKDDILQRKQVLGHIIDTIKKNKDAVDILGQAIIQNNKHSNYGGDGNDNMDQLDFDNDDDFINKQKYHQHPLRVSGIVIEDENSVEAGNSQSAANQKLYQSENMFKHKKVAAQSSPFKNKQYNKLPQDSSRDMSQLMYLENSEDGGLNLQLNTNQKYQELQQETSRDDLTTTQVYNDMDFQSAPIDAQTTLKRNPDLSQKFRMFQQELDQKQDQMKRDAEARKKEQVNNQKTSKFQRNKAGKNQGNKNGTPTKQSPTRSNNKKSPDQIEKNCQKSNKLNQKDQNNQILKKQNQKIFSPNQDIENIFENNLEKNNTPNNKSDYSHYNTYSQNKSQKSNNKNQLGEQDKNNLQYQDSNTQFEDGLTEKDFISNNMILQKYEISKINKKLDQTIISDIKQDLKISTDQKNKTQKEVFSQVNLNTQLEAQIEIDKQKRDEEIQVVEVLQQNIEDLRLLLQIAKQKRDEQLNFIDQAQYTSDEDDMGISPSSYDVLNQRFNNIGDVQIYINTMGEENIIKEKQEELDRLKTSWHDEGLSSFHNQDTYEPSLNGEINENRVLQKGAKKSKGKKKGKSPRRKIGDFSSSTGGGLAKIVPMTVEDEERLRRGGEGVIDENQGDDQNMSGQFGDGGRLGGTGGGRKRVNNRNNNSQPRSITDRTGQLNLHKSPLYNKSYDENEEYDDEDENEEGEYDDEDQNNNEETINKLGKNKDNLNRLEFVKMIEEESNAAIERMRKMNNNSSNTQFQEYAEQFMRNLSLDLSQETLNTKKLIDYIKELDEKEKLEIQKRKSKYSDNISKKKKSKKKKAKTGKDDILKYGPYFNYTPFEWAVISSKGKAPFNNEHVEIIANKGYDKDNVGFWSPTTHQKGDNQSAVGTFSKLFYGQTPHSRQTSSRGGGGATARQNGQNIIGVGGGGFNSISLKKNISSDTQIPSLGGGRILANEPEFQFKQKEHQQ